MTDGDGVHSGLLKLVPVVLHQVTERDRQNFSTFMDIDCQCLGSRYSQYKIDFMSEDLAKLQRAYPKKLT